MKDFGNTAGALFTLSLGCIKTRSDSMETFFLWGTEGAGVPGSEKSGSNRYGEEGRRCHKSA